MARSGLDDPEGFVGTFGRHLSNLFGKSDDGSDVRGRISGSHGHLPSFMYRLLL
jgi:hypothetical protein